jgi:hypothetical protein
VPARRLWIPGAYATVERISEPDADGWQTADLVLQSEREACSYVLGFGPLMRVVAPDTLRERVIREARAISEIYGTLEPSGSATILAAPERSGQDGRAPGGESAERQRELNRPL